MGKKLPIFYNALLLTGVNLLLRFAGTAFQVYITGRIGAAGVGLLQLVLSVGMLALTAGIAGVRTATIYLAAEELGKKRPQNITWVLSGCFFYSILCSGAIAAALYFFAPQIAGNWLGSADAVPALRMLAGFLPVSCLCGVMSGYFTAANRIGTLAAVGVAEQSLSMMLTFCTLCLWADSDPVRACQCVVFGSGMGSCLTLTVLIILRLKERAAHGKHMPMAGKLYRTAVPLALADDLKSGISTAENLMVPKRLALFHGTDNPLATFGMISGMVFPILMFPACILFSLAELLIPELARCNASGSFTRIRYLVRRSLRVGMLYGFLFGGLLYLAAPWLCQALYKHEEAGLLLRKFAFLVPMLYCDTITDAINKGLGKQTAAMRINIVTAALDVLFLFLLLPKYGVSGYYFSFLVTHLINFALSIWLLTKTSGVRFSLLSPALILPATCLCVFLSSKLRLCFAIPAFIALFFSLMSLTGILKKEDRHWIRGLIKK